jgi:hypothetical protein
MPGAPASSFPVATVPPDPDRFDTGSRFAPPAAGKTTTFFCIRAYMVLRMTTKH